MINALGDRIRTRATALGLKQADLMRAAGVTRPTAHAWWHGGVTELKTKHIEPLSRLLRCNAKWLISGMGPVESADSDPAVREPQPTYAAKIFDPTINEALELLQQLTPADRREAVAWLRGFGAGRKRELPGRSNSRVQANTG